MIKARYIAVAMLVVVAFVGPQVEAEPPGLPTVFYGTVGIGSAIPSDARVTVSIGGRELAEAKVREESILGTVYGIDVPADDADTPDREGGRDGEAVTFQIELPNGRRYGTMQTGVWQGGTAMQLDLTARHSVRLPLIIRPAGQAQPASATMRSRR